MPAPILTTPTDQPPTLPSAGGAGEALTTLKALLSYHIHRLFSTDDQEMEPAERIIPLLLEEVTQLTTLQEALNYWAYRKEEWGL